MDFKKPVHDNDVPLEFTPEIAFCSHLWKEGALSLVYCERCGVELGGLQNMRINHWIKKISRDRP